MTLPIVLPLSDRQREALRAIFCHIDAHGVAPTVVELSQALGLRHPTASYGYVGALEPVMHPSATVPERGA